MGVTVEELQILVRADITDALAGMNQLRDQLKKTLSAELPNLQKQLQPVKQSLDQYGDAFTTRSQKAQEAKKQTGDKVKQTAQATQQAVNAVKQTMSGMGNPLQSVNKQIDEQGQKLSQLQGKYASVAEEAAQVNAPLRTSAKRVPSALASEIDERQTPAAAEPSASIAQPPSLAPWERFKAQYFAILDSIKAKLNEAGLYGNPSNIFGGERLSGVLNGVKSSLSDVTKYTNAATSATKKWGQQAESSSNKATSGFSRTGNMISRMLIRMAIWKTVSAVFNAAKTGIDDMVQASSNANSTMSQLATSVLYLKNSIGAALMPAIQAIAPILTQIIDKIAQLFNMIGMLSARIFGGASSITVAKQAAVNYAETLGKVGDAAKKANGSLADFDELKVIQTPKSEKSDAGAGMPSYGNMFETQKIPQSLSTVGDKIKAELQEWAKYAQPTKDAFDRLVGSLGPLKTFAAKGLEDFYNDFLKPVGKWVLGKGLPEFLDTTTKIVKSVDWKQLNKALDDFWKVLAPFTKNIGEGLLWFYKNVIAPIEVWALNTVIPKSIEIISTALDIVNQIIDKMKPTVQDFYQNVLVPLGTWLGNFISDDLDFVLQALQTIDDLLKGDMPKASADAQTALSTLGNIINDIFGVNIPKAINDAEKYFTSGRWAEDGKNIINGLINGIESLFKDPIQFGEWLGGKIVDGFKSILGIHSPSTVFEQMGNYIVQGLQNGIANLWNTFIARVNQLIGVFKAPFTALGTWWNTTISTWWANDVSPWFTAEKWTALFDFVRQAAVQKCSDISGWWNNTVSSWWLKDVSPWFTAKKWEDMMAGVGDAFKSTFKNAVNAGIELFNQFIDWVNTRMKFHWDAIKIAGKTVAAAGSVQLFSIPTIPKLATGAVIRQSTIVNLGEYAGAATNPEIASPQSLMRDTVRDANGPLTAEMLNAISEMTARLETAIRNAKATIALDGVSLERHMRPIRQAEDSRIGGKLFEV